MHPLDGSWIANIDKSRRDPNHHFQRATMKFEVDGDRVSLTYGGINAGGRQEHGTQVLQADGRERAVPQAPDVMAAARVEPRALITTAKKGDEEVGRARYEVSEDGASMTATVCGIDAQGNKFEQVILFEREVVAV
jgi:hypothetical protein